LVSIVHATSLATCAACAVLIAYNCSVYHWIVSSVEAVVSNLNLHGQTWIEKLVQHISQIINDSSAAGKNHTFQAKNFLVGWRTQHKFVFRCPQNIKSKISVNILNFSIQAACLWLGYPTDNEFKAQCYLIHTLLYCKNTAVLYLDQVWEMYISPFQMVLGTDAYKTQNKMNTALDKFQIVFQQQDWFFPKSISPSRVALEHLRELVKWSGVSLVQQSDPIFPEGTDIDVADYDFIITQTQENRSQKMIDFLLSLKPLLQLSFEQGSTSKNKLWKKVSKNPD